MSDSPLKSLDALIEKLSAEMAVPRTWVDRLGYTPPESNVVDEHCYICNAPVVACVESCGVCYFPTGLGLLRIVPKPSQMTLDELYKAAFPDQVLADPLVWGTTITLSENTDTSMYYRIPSGSTQTVTKINAKTGRITISAELLPDTLPIPKKSPKKKKKR